MRPTKFVEKWKSVELKKRTAAQSHFIDPCHLLGVDDPVTADPHPPDLVQREPELVLGCTDHIIPVDVAAETVLPRRTLSNLYNTLPAWLINAHRALDDTVAEAYGCGEAWHAGTLNDDEILARPFKLNQEHRSTSLL